MAISKIFSCSLMLVVLLPNIDARSTSNQERCVYSKWLNVMNCRGEGWDDVPYEHLTEEVFSTLDLGDNNIDVMKDISRFDKLLDSSQVTDLLLDHNNLSKLPSNLYRKLPNVQGLDVSYNNIEHVSKSFCRFENLTHLDLRGNPIKTISKRLPTCLPGLKFYVDDNISTSLPMSSEARVLPTPDNLDDYFHPAVGLSQVNALTTNTNDNYRDNKSKRDEELSSKSSRFCVGFAIVFILFSVVIIRNN